MKLSCKLTILIGLSSFLLSSTALAARCDFIDGTNTVDRIVPLIGGDITVGRDVPVGTVIFKQVFFSSNLASRVTCEPGIYNNVRDRKLTSTPLPLLSWPGANSGKLYESGVPGIGVYLFSEWKALPDYHTFENCGGGSEFCISNPELGFEIFLIKTGDVSPGVIHGALLPSMQTDWKSPENALVLQRVGFAGTINVVSRTCLTPDVNVALGTHSTSKFSGVGSGSAWKDFKITLNNCPAFHGTFPGPPSNPPPQFDATGDVGTEQGRAPNVLGFRLDPTDGILDAVNGIISLTPAPSGYLPAATGIGIQIGTGDVTPVPVPLSTIHSSGIVTTATEGGSYAIPLSARYVQTASAIKPGPANGALVFTIEYH